MTQKKQIELINLIKEFMSNKLETKDNFVFNKESLAHCIGEADGLLHIFDLILDYGQGRLLELANEYLNTKSQVDLIEDKFFDDLEIMAYLAAKEIWSEDFDDVEVSIDELNQEYQNIYNNLK